MCLDLLFKASDSDYIKKYSLSCQATGHLLHACHMNGHSRRAFRKDLSPGFVREKKNRNFLSRLPLVFNCWLPSRQYVTSAVKDTKTKTKQNKKIPWLGIRFFASVIDI